MFYGVNDTEDVKDELDSLDSSAEQKSVAEALWSRLNTFFWLLVVVVSAPVWEGFDWELEAV